MRTMIVLNSTKRLPWVGSLFCFARKGWKPMTTEKPDIRVLCYRCWRNYINAGIRYLQIHTAFKDSCEMCGYHEGYEYVEVKRKKQHD